MSCRVKYLGRATTLRLPNGIRVEAEPGVEFAGLLAEVLVAHWPGSFLVLAPGAPDRLTREAEPEITKG